MLASQVEQWSVLSNDVNYVQYDNNSRDQLHYNLDVMVKDQKELRKMYDRLKEEDRQVIELDFGDILDKLKGEYLDMYDGIKSEVLSTAKLEENLDLSTT